MQVRESTLALKPRADITRSPKQGHQWPYKRTCVLQKFKKKKFNITNTGQVGLILFTTSCLEFWIFELNILFLFKVLNNQKV